MSYTKYARPYVIDKIQMAEQAQAEGQFSLAFAYLEDAHVIGQKSTQLHCLVHYLMLKQAILKVNAVDIIGQGVRLFGAFSKTAIGLLPTGNTGGTNVSPFKAMPISSQNQQLIDMIEQQMKNKE